MEKKHLLKQEKKCLNHKKKRPPDSEETKRKKGEMNKGKAKSDDHKRKISKTFKEKGIVDGKNNPFYGKRHTKESRIKISKTRKRINGMDETHPQWNEIISPLSVRIRNSVDYKKWVNDIFVRDNYICKKCGKRGGTRQAHHCNQSFSEILKNNNILTFEEAIECKELWDIENGETLCVKCHDKEHKTLNFHISKFKDI